MSHLGALPGPSSLHTLGAAAVYAVVFGFVFAECGLLVGFLLPGDTLLIAAGAVAATQPDRISLAAMAAGAFAAAVAGEVLGYLIGARAGPAVLRRRGGPLSPATLARAETLTDRYGSLAVLAARWIPWVRTFVPTLAGAIGMAWPRFLLANVAGALCWVPTLVLIGYFAASVPALRPVALVVAGAAVAGAAVAGAVRWRLAANRRDPPGKRGAGHRPPGGDR
ncbi:MAG TPA: DedA family protein [Mycobacteriales bacterium]|nr:DedA family protein [Mycobacteriales bacterium]